ncbi:MAG: PKD domain-containing protein, partial [Dehalogenimonas sp.]
MFENIMIYIQKLLTALFFLFPILAISQNQANNWYFSPREGLDFNSGYPVIIDKSIDYMLNSTCLSDTTGKLLFYTDGNTVWNTDLDTLQNGFGLFAGNNNQPAVIVPNPGNSNQYYIFTVGGEDLVIGLRYSIIDISLDNGKGAVTSKNILVDEGVWARHRVAAVRHSNNRDFWIITRTKDNNNIQSWAVFLLTPTGLDPVPVISYAPNMTLFNIAIDGEIKVSQDRKKMISLHSSNANHHGALDISSFNASTGQIIHHFMISEYYSYGSSRGMYGMEISPDSKLVYCTVSSDTNYSLLYQYDLTKIDSAQFVNSGIVIDTCYTKRLQLAPDGKIYGDHLQGNSDRFLDIIHDVWARDSECSLVKNAIFLGPEVLQNHRVMLPTFMSELLYRFVWQGGPCAKTPFTFRHRFIPEPDSIVWNFGDGSTSTDFNPTHIFQSGGNYEVHAHVVYPDGRIEETSREVEVLAAPEPQLPDTLMLCTGESGQLDAGSGFTQYLWMGQFTPGNQYYPVTDTGTYTVRVRNNLNCYAYDTTRVVFYPPPLLDQSNITITPTTCNNATGSITGLVVEAGTTVSWKDNAGLEISNEIDINNLGVGNYFLWLTDDSGCTVLMETYTINNLDSDLIVENAQPTHALCGRKDGQIVVTLQQGLGTMQYSITNGPPYFDNGGVFENLPPGSYYVRVIDELGCDAVYAANPVEVENLGGPVITGIFPNPATGSGNDGSINITATGDSVYYSLDGGPGQLSGEFTDLTAGDYQITVADKYGCDTTFIVTVEQLTGYALSAIAGTDRKCLLQQAASALKVTNLNGVKEFRVGVLFDTTRLSLQGFSDKFIPEMTATDFGDRVIFEWQEEESLALSDTVNLITLIFETIQPGTADVNWDVSAASWFRDENGIDIPVQPIDGNVKITSPPLVVTGGNQRKCEDDFAIVSANVLSGGVEPFVWEWTKPDGSKDSESSLWLFGLTQAESGTYTLKLTDAYQCVVEDTVELIVIPSPTANFPTTTDTIYYEQQTQLQAT